MTEPEVEQFEVSGQQYFASFDGPAAERAARDYVRLHDASLLTGVVCQGRNDWGQVVYETYIRPRAPNAEDDPHGIGDAVRRQAEYWNTHDRLGD